jgi:16S rRNA (cytidine1402-2'-O)-methyltransferase
MPSLYLIPNLLGDTPWQQVLPAVIPQIVKNLQYFIVEDVRNARRFLKKLDPEIGIDELHFDVLNKFTSEEQKAVFLDPIRNGNDVGLLSEAGCPGVADPGADIVRIAHRNDFRVVPLTGPSSVLLAMMASGLNGQQFVFHGYLPVKQSERIKKIQHLEKQAVSLKQTQIFIETPYRNNQLLQDILKTCQSATLLCVAADLSTDIEFIHTRNISAWKNQVPDLDKHPTIFLLGI